MQIYGPSQLQGTQPIQAPQTDRVAEPQTGGVAPHQGDQVEISDAARLASQLSDVPDIRHERVAEIRASIAEGTYDTEAKLDVAVDRLLDEIG